MKLKLANDLSLPLDVVTQTIAIIAKRRAGKSYTMRRLFEQLFKAGQQVVLVDPKGDQWGIRSAADGKAPGLPIIILGGERGDVKLEASAGEVVAKLVVEERVSALLDLSLFRKHEVATFMTAFLENLYRLKAREAYRTPLMLVIDEADAVAPQKPQHGEERMLGAAEDIVRRGGQRGIGCVLVTQRSAVLNKNVLTQAQILVALRTIAPQDLKAMDEWIQVHGGPEQRKILMESLPSLPVGDAWFWSPGWPTTDGIFKRVHVLPIETFDSGASPKPGVKPVEPKKAADVDLAALERQMAATIEKSKADDPRELRKQVAELKSQLAKKDAVLADVDTKTKRIETKVGKTAEQATAITQELTAARARLRRAKSLIEECMKFIIKVKAVNFSADQPVDQDALHAAVAAVVKNTLAPMRTNLERKASEIEGLKKRAGQLEAAVQELLDQKIEVDVTVAKAEPFRISEDRPTPRRAVTSRPTNGSSDESVPAGERAVLTAIAQYPNGVTRKQLAVLTGYKKTSRDTYLAKLVQKGFIAAKGVGVVVVTDEGVNALGSDFEPLPTGPDLLDWWRQRLPEGERTVLDVIVNAHPQAIARADLEQATGYKKTSRDTYLAKLVSRQLIVADGPGIVRASEELFS